MHIARTCYHRCSVTDIFHDITYWFDSLLGVKPKHSCVSELSQFQSLHLDPPPSQILDLNLTQLSTLIPRHSTRTSWATNISTSSLLHKFTTWCELSGVIPSCQNLLSPKVLKHSYMSDLLEQILSHPEATLTTDQPSPCNQPSLGQHSSLLMKTSCLRLKLVTSLKFLH